MRSVSLVDGCGRITANRLDSDGLEPIPARGIPGIDGFLRDLLGRRET